MGWVGWGGGHRLSSRAEFSSLRLPPNPSAILSATPSRGPFTPSHHEGGVDGPRAGLEEDGDDAEEVLAAGGEEDGMAKRRKSKLGEAQKRFWSSGSGGEKGRKFSLREGKQ